MKIAFLYAYKTDEIWSTPLAWATEFQSRGWEVDIFSLVSSTGNYTDAGLKMMHDQIRSGQYKPNIIFFLDWGNFDSPLLDKKLYSEAFWIQEAGDEGQNFKRNFPKSDRFHLTISPDYVSTHKYIEAGRNALWVTHFADTMIHYPMISSLIYDAVCTRGYGTSGILDRLKHHLGARFFNENGFEGLKHAEALQKGRMVVQHARHGEITRRIFEAMACGKMVLTDRLDKETKLQELFRDQVEIVYYDDYEDCLKKLEYYSSHTNEREQIAQAGRDAVLKNHTQYQRVNTILYQFRLWKASQ